jgi:hypothetical protein
MEGKTLFVNDLAKSKFGSDYRTSGIREED